jgi:hypothetical protein
MTASTLGIGPHDMSGWTWFAMTLITVLWLVVAVAAVYIAVLAARDRGQGRSGA